MSALHFEVDERTTGSDEWRFVAMFETQEAAQRYAHTLPGSRIRVIRHHEEPHRHEMSLQLDKTSR